MSETPEGGMSIEALAGRPRARMLPLAERRQSRRLRVRIPLLLDLGGRRDPCWTVTANEGGALVAFSRPVEAGQRVTVLNVTTGKTAVARVVAPLLSDPVDTSPTAGFRLALRLETFGVRFWGPVYYEALEEAEAAAKSV